MSSPDAVASHRKSAPTSKRNGNHNSTSLQECAVMILDVRGSTKQLSRPNLGPDKAAKRVEDMRNALTDIFGTDDLPSFLKSTGDGFFCVWEFIKSPLHLEQLRILQATYRVYIQLPERIRQSDPVVSGEIGIGLTFGTLARYSDRTNTDYFGYYANLAAKLQDSARPSGLVVDAEPLSRWPPKQLGSALQDFKLKYKDTHSSPLRAFELNGCYATDSVELVHDWTCLAWPGFAVAEQDGHSGFDRKSFGLSTRGITVITHEGLQGKIGSLAISRAFRSDTHGEHFQIYIDDYDALEVLHRQDQVSLLSFSSTGASIREIKEKLSSAVPNSCYQDRVGFIPVRCGINGLAANSRFPWSLKKFDTYSALLKDIEAADKTSLSLGEIALYENVGATLPILVMAANPEITYETVLDATDSVLEKTLEVFLNLVKSKNKRFALYSSIDDLSRHLCNGTVKLVLGGGAWLATPDLRYSNDLFFDFPKTSGALLWIEGAALHRKSVGDEQALLQFLSESVLSEDFQDRLPFVGPYPSCPCGWRSIDKIRNLQHPEGPGRYIMEETKRAFQTEHSLQENISIRRAPTQNPAASQNPSKWMEIFLDIVQQCCNHRR